MKRALLCAAFICPVLSAEITTFRLGVDVLMEALDNPRVYPGYADLVLGRRVGLITNQTGRNREGVPTVDLLHAHDAVNLTLLFAPEHGIRGVIPAGEAVDESIDSQTGLTIHSLYGANDKRPPRVLLDQVDVLFYDIQDVGSRAYTYIWSMAEAMAAAGEHDKTFVVLDRPNPLGGHTIDGPITESKWLSFIGLYPIPRVYGMTAGELARYLNREHELDCNLVVVPMTGYGRDLKWEDLGLEWIPPSPNIPSAASAATFAATGTLGTLGEFYIGVGTPHAFQLVGASWLNSQASAEALNAYELPGVKFVPVVVPNTSGGHGGGGIQAVYLQLTEPTRFLPATTELVLLRHLQSHYGDQWRWRSDCLKRFDKAMGTSIVRRSIVGGVALSDIVGEWEIAHGAFNDKRLRYLIYE